MSAFILDAYGTTPQFADGYGADGYANAFINLTPDLMDTSIVHPQIPVNSETASYAMWPVIDSEDYMEHPEEAGGVEGPEPECPAKSTIMEISPQELVDMDKVHSKAGFDGVEPGTFVNIGAPKNTSPDAYYFVPLEDQFVEISTTKVGELFDPQAMLIIIDNRQPNDLNPVLRPYGSLDNIYSEFNGVRIRNSEDIYVSGGYVSRFYNPQNKTMTSYYYDHNNSHWIKNIQQMPDNISIYPRNGIGVANNARMPLVFPWIYRGRQSGIV